MSARDRWERVERLYHAALALDPTERAAFLRETCSDEGLRQEVESLLSYESNAHEFLKTPAVEFLAPDLLPADKPPALADRRFGQYELLSLLGAGGMGEVFRARDTTLEREVAIKILPSVFATDPDRRARFAREARLLAALNHPHIAAIYDFEEHNGVAGLILELVEGETLAARLRAGALPVREALMIARQIADALDAAHARGIVHRDLKPANITITPDGRVKVLDFGLAKATVDTSLHASTATAHTGATEPGVILGTAAYMSPEQARGKPVDKRTDVWAFGCVLWEMLTGRAAFAGETASDTLAAILDRTPDWRLLPQATPPAVTQLLQRCLEKDPKRRLHDIADGRIELDDAIALPATPAIDAPRRSPLSRRAIMAGAVGLMAIAAAVVWAIVPFPRPADIGTATRLSVWTPGWISAQLSATISPDGRQLAFVSTGGSGKLMLWIRALDALEARVLPGTEDAAHPFWSPDGRQIGFLAHGKVKTTDLVGGPVATLADAPIRTGPTWSRSGVILFGSRPGELGTVPASGGPVTTVVPRRDGSPASWPHFLPDGRRFLYRGGAQKSEERGIYVGSLDSPETKFVLRSDTKAAYADGYLVFVRDGQLMVQPFDANRLELSGEPSRLAQGVWAAPGAGQASFSASEHVVAYVNAAVTHGQLSLFDREGRPVGRVADSGSYSGGPRMSPDGRHVAIAESTGANQWIWLFDVTGGSKSRFTFGSTRDAQPHWSNDGKRLVYRADATFFVKDINGGEPRELATIPSVPQLEDWSADERLIVYSASGPRSLSDLWLLPLAADRKPVPFLQTAFNKTQAQISPDGKWIAYTSYESGRDEVYVQSFPKAGRQKQVSVNGGAQPRWRRDGGELFYLAPDQQLMAVPIIGGDTFETGAPVPLFKTRTLPHGSQSTGLPTMYDVSPDGQRFVFAVPPDEPAAPITVILNWRAALKETVR